MAKEVTSLEFSKKVLENVQPVLVDMYASWCGPCRIMSPIIDELEKELAPQGCTIVKVNIDDARDLAINYSVSSIPAFLFFKGGKLVVKELGVQSKETLKKKLLALL